MKISFSLIHFAEETNRYQLFLKVNYDSTLCKHKIEQNDLNFPF